MKGTKIQWTDATWNVAVGCTKVDEDCKFCYMYRGSLNDTRYNPKTVRKTKTVFDFPLKFKMEKSGCWNGRPLIFTSSLTDVFHPDCDSFRNEMWDIIRQCPHFIFQILTKRPERIAAHLPEDWGSGWEHVWLGTSVGHFRSIERIQILSTIPSRTRFISLEPLHGPIDLRWILRSPGKCKTCGGSGEDGSGDRVCPSCGYDYRHNMGKRLIDWVIVGGESGNETGKYRYRPCGMTWIRGIVHDCRSAGVSVFVKQLGTHLSKELGLKDRHGGDMEEWPEEIRVREFPQDKTLQGFETLGGLKLKQINDG